MKENLYQNRYRIPSTRLPEWDYSLGEYFITICTKDKENYFGNVVDWKMQLNELWKIVEDEILNTSKFRTNVIADEFIVMPNHIHLILFIEHINRRDGLQPSNSDVCNAFLQDNKFWPQKNNLATIIRWLKWSITSQIQKIDKNFSRQTRFFEHIIRNEKELDTIREYIQNNPFKWELEKDNNLDF